jgi:hypothetical protein
MVREIMVFLHSHGVGTAACHGASVAALVNVLPLSRLAAAASLSVRRNSRSTARPQIRIAASEQTPTAASKAIVARGAVTDPAAVVGGQGPATTTLAIIEQEMALNARFMRNDGIHATTRTTWRLSLCSVTI